MSGAAAIQRFRATILKQGSNPYVDVPARISQAFSSLARAGRIRVDGTLNGTSIRATLIPTGAGGHRLYVNGGMRSAADVDVGDSVSFALRATKPEIVRLPKDVGTFLRSVGGATAAFDALPPSHRRELLRYIDDARTGEARERRIQKTIEHLLGTAVAARPRGAAGRRSSMRSRTLWTCPKCGNDFVNRNQYHSCRRYELSEPFRGKPVMARALFDRFRELVEACGPVKVVPYRDRVGFMVRVRFAGATPRRRCLDIGFWLPRRIASRRFHRVETIGPSVHLHVVRIVEPEQLDAEVRGWLSEAYAVGCQEHLGVGQRRGGSPESRRFACSAIDSIEPSGTRARFMRGRLGREPIGPT